MNNYNEIFKKNLISIPVYQNQGIEQFQDNVKMHFLLSENDYELKNILKDLEDFIDINYLIAIHYCPTTLITIFSRSMMDGVHYETNNLAYKKTYKTLNFNVIIKDCVNFAIENCSYREKLINEKVINF
jgi:hypothetical protein